MFEALAMFVTGFFVAVWIGAVLGVFRAWNGRVFLVLMLLLAAFVIVAVHSAGPTEFAMGADWAYIGGTLPGYMIGIPGGEILYEEAVR